MIVGIDSFATHLDQITWVDFTNWNGGTTVAFAGRNFLGGNFLWGHSEATDSLTNPNPDLFANLQVQVPLVAPICRLDSHRQVVTGNLGFNYGAMDGAAICARLSWSMDAGEFHVQASRFVHVWLAVDSTIAFSADYWAGWSSTVNSYMPQQYGAIPTGTTRPYAQPFMAGILCQFVPGIGGLLQPEPHVATVLAGTSYSSQRNTRAYALWADAPSADAAGVAPGPAVDWTRFATASMPAIWRFANTIKQADGTAITTSYSVDVVREVVAPDLDATAFMLQPQTWQPSRNGEVGFSNEDPLTPNQINTCIANTNLADMADSSGQQVMGGSVMFVGGYIKLDAQANPTNIAINRAEALNLAALRVPMFTIWENVNPNSHGEPVWPDPGAAGPHPTAIGIQYFNPRWNAGTYDGQHAFQYAGTTLFQPPHTTIFFAIDGDPQWTNQIAGQPAGTTEGQWLTQYFQQIVAARDAYTAQNPDRPYLIGVYAGGRVCMELYKLGMVDMFWQTMSPGFDGSAPAQHHWPWCHANRWQYNGDRPYCGGLNQVDPDMDWGDGGTWLLTDPLNQSLEALENAAAQQRLHDFMQQWYPFFQFI
jgi:hypothetical protein